MSYTTTLKVGDIAPDFVLFDQNKKEIHLADLKGKKVLLSFHPLAWTGVCTKQMQTLEQNFDRFEKVDTIPIGVSIDTIPSKKAWSEHLGISKISLLSDFWEHGKIAKAYGLFREKEGFSQRANILIDENQKIEFIKIYDIPQLPDIEEIFSLLEV
ncbi:MAG: peroxiredoxin [Candidatus Thorarchaeota archaeon]